MASPDKVLVVNRPLMTEVEVGGQPVATTNPLAVKVSDGTHVANIHPIDTQIHGDEYGIVTNAVLHGKTTAGGGSFVDVKVSPSGAVQVGGDVVVSGTVAITGPVAVTDNSGSLTVDGSVTVTQGTATNLKAQAEAYVGGTAVSNANPVPISDAGGSITVDGPLTNAQLRAAAVPVRQADGANLDAFSRLRVSQPQGLFDGQFTYNLLPLQYEPITNGTGATITHDSTNRCALMTFSNTATGGKAYLQSYEYVRYQPGRSQAAFVTFNFVEAKTDCLKFAGVSDWGSVSAGVGNGIEFQLSGSTKQFTVYSDTGVGDETVTQANWNLDKLDGTGASGIALNMAYAQILVIDFQALYVGRIRVGFDIGGNIVYAHEFNHSNLLTNPYIQYATLPVRCGMTCTGTVSTTMNFICSAVISEGGQEENGGVPAAAEGTATAGSGADTHILSVRPKTTFNSITNRVKLVLDSVEILVTGNQPVLYKLVVGQAISGTTTYSDVNTTYSAFEFNTAGTISGTAALVLQQGYVPASNQTKAVANPKITNRIPIALSAAGAVRANGTVSVLVQGVGGTSACRASLNWRELR